VVVKDEVHDMGMSYSLRFKIFITVHFFFVTLTIRLKKIIANM
jgi:cytochrome bd-type quinol oxidase subunit 1